MCLQESRGGILEPEGTVEIKFRQKDKVKTMGRLDSVYSNLLEKLKTEMPVERREEMEEELRHREETLNSIYHQVTLMFLALNMRRLVQMGAAISRSPLQVAVHFADLHDTPGRMMEKGVILVRPLLAETTASHTLTRFLSNFPALFRTSWSGRGRGNISTGVCAGDSANSGPLI